MLRVLETKTRQLHFCSCLAIQRKGGVHEKREQEKDYIFRRYQNEKQQSSRDADHPLRQSGNLYLYVTEKLGFWVYFLTTTTDY